MHVHWKGLKITFDTCRRNRQRGLLRLDKCREEKKVWWRSNSKTVSYIHSKLLWESNIWGPNYKAFQWNGWGIIWWKTDLWELKHIRLPYTAWLVSITTYRTHPLVCVLHKVLFVHTKPWISKLANIEKEKLLETSIKLCRSANIKKSVYMHGMPLEIQQTYITR